MRRNTVITSMLVLVLFGCGDSDSSGLYAPRNRTTAADAGFSSAPGTNDDDASAPKQCDNDKSCAPDVCNKELGVCAALGEPGDPCARDVECESRSCDDGECE